jgi:hypothetical protein
MGIQDRDYWREWHREREDSNGFRRRPPEPPGAQWHWSLKVLVWLLIAGTLFAVFKRVEPRRNTPRPAAASTQDSPTPTQPPWPAAPSPSQTFQPPHSGYALPAPAPTPAPIPSRVTIYLCKDYSGGMFWASNHCSQHRALIDRMESVPSNLPWDQQVLLAQQARNRAAELTRPPPVMESRTVIVNNMGNTAACEALEQHIVHLDAMARQPQSAQMQDWIKAQKADARSQQFRLRC